MTPYTFHITFYDLIIFGMIFTGWVFCLFLWFVKSINRSANRFLALALLTMTLWMLRILHVNLPAQMLLAVGPLLYFYVLKITQGEYKFKRKDLLHLSPLVFIVVPAPVLQILVFTAVIAYLYLANQLIQRFYKGLQPVLMDRSLLEFRWLRRLLGATALLWVLWFVSELGLPVYGSVYIFFAVMIIWTAAAAFLRPQAGIIKAIPVIQRTVPAELKQKSIWLKKMMESKHYYLDSELTLNSLAERLSLTIHELSRIINTVLKKSFNDFINEYRVAEVIMRMQDIANDHLTLTGIAYDCGFNSPSTFHRAFKEMTGKTPAEYKKELSSYNLTYRASTAALISNHKTTHKWHEEKLNRNYMFRNYLKVAWRNLVKNKFSSIINIGGLAVGMAVAMLIGLWIWDEVSYDSYNKNYSRIVQVTQNVTDNNVVGTYTVLPFPLANELRNNYGSDFKYVVMSSGANDHILSFGTKNFTKSGAYSEAQAPELMDLTMLYGTKDALKDPDAVILSESVAKAYFGNADPVNKVMKIDNRQDVKVSGVYKDLPHNSEFSYVSFIASWQLLANAWQLDKMTNPWRPNAFQVYARLADKVDMAAVSEKIRDIKMRKVNKDELFHKPQLFLQPISKWHLYSDFKNGVNIGGRIKYVWLFGIIGVFVLILACINFMNLNTARSEKRAREVGIRKAVGSLRRQLIFQFFCESLLVACFAFAISLLLVQLALPFFNQVVDKQMTILWYSPLFWLCGIGFALLTGLIAGSYPALYLSSFQPVKVLKGTFKTGRFAAMPRKTLIVFQFTVSIVMIIGTVVVFNQVQFAKNRPMGFNLTNVVMFPMSTPDVHRHFDAVKNELLQSGTIKDMAESNSYVSNFGFVSGGFEWKGKPPGVQGDFPTNGVSYGYGETAGWQFVSGRGFSKDFSTDSAAFILNETAVKFMGLKNPVGEVIKWQEKPFKVIGVIKDPMVESPYAPVRPLFTYLSQNGGTVTIKLNPNVSTNAALSKIETVFKKYSPSQPFNYQFADTQYARKFGDEQRIGTLASFFAVLAIFISCIGLFGMASFMAEQRVKEIGVRKVLGATVFNLWGLLSKDFVLLVTLSLVIASPLAYYFMHKWLQNYTYHSEISWWIFASTAICAMAITLLTVSYQSIKAALANPVKSLRSE